MDAGLQTPTHPDIVAFYLSRLQLVLMVEWLPQAMPDESHVFRKVVPGTLPGHRLRPAGVLLPSRGDPPQDRTAPPGPPPPDTTAPQAQYHPWMPPLFAELLSSGAGTVTGIQATGFPTSLPALGALTGCLYSTTAHHRLHRHFCTRRAPHRPCIHRLSRPTPTAHPSVLRQPSTLRVLILHNFTQNDSAALQNRGIGPHGHRHGTPRSSPIGTTTQSTATSPSTGSRQSQSFAERYATQRRLRWASARGAKGSLAQAPSPAGSSAIGATGAHTVFRTAARSPTARLLPAFRARMLTAKGATPYHVARDQARQAAAS